jgi:hypothetical protein
MTATGKFRTPAGNDDDLWVVDHCPHCGRRHTHGGGLLDGDPRAYLGSRVAHCHAGPDYVLVEAATKTARK